MTASAFWQCQACGRGAWTAKDLSCIHGCLACCWCMPACRWIQVTVSWSALSF